jgi:CRISPR-associated protein Cas2
MMALLIYDIVHDGRRVKAAEVCKDFGLSRIQYSAFLGDLSHARQGELLQKLRRCLGRTDARIHLFPLCERDLRLTRVLGVGKLAPETLAGPLALARAEGHS